MQRTAKLIVVLAFSAALLPVVASAATFSRALFVGMSGPDVVALQQTLSIGGYFKLTATGYFGPATKRAVVAYQAAHNLPSTGVIGPLTRALLNAAATTSQGATATGSSTVPVQLPVTMQTIPSATTTVGVQTTSASSSAATTSQQNASLVVTVTGPAPVLPANTLSTTLSVATTRNATCRWGTLPNMAITSMNAFLSTGGMNHSIQFTSLANGNLYVYYVKCQDNVTGAITGDTMVSFSLAAH